MTIADDLRARPVADKRAVIAALLHQRQRSVRSYPLSFAQQQLWFMDKLQPGLPVYNIPLYVPLQGDVEAATIERSLTMLVQRHDMLRASFELSDDGPRQTIPPDTAVVLPIEDLSMISPGARDLALGESLNREVQQPFDLERGPCVRYRLYRLDRYNYLLAVTMHHIITDAWSLGVFVSELNRIYDALRVRGQDARLEPLLVDYTDYARWQREHLRGLRLSVLLDYWRQELDGAPHVLHLPTDHERPGDQTFNGTVLGFRFDDSAHAKVIEFSRQHKVTVFTVLLACYFVLLYRYSGQEDMLVGAPVANRGHPDLEPIIGLFVNTLVLRARLHENIVFSEVLDDVRTTTLGAYEHQSLPFERLVDELRVDRLPGFAPLYQVVFNFQNAALIESAAPDAEGEVMERGDFPFVHSSTAKVDVNLTVTLNDASISGGIEYNTDLFEPSSIEAMIANYRTIVAAVMRDPSLAVLEIPLLADGDDRAVPGAASSPNTAAEASGFPAAGRFDFEFDHGDIDHGSLA